METVSLPSDLELEKSVLGAVLIDNRCFEEVHESVSSEDFYDRRNVLIFEAMSELFLKSMPIDMMTLRDSMGSKFSEVGVIYLSELTCVVATAVNVAKHAEVLRGLSAKRKAALAADKIVSLAMSPDSKPDEVINEMQREAAKMTLDAKEDKTNGDISEIADRLFDKIGEKKPDSVLSGFKKLDEITTGFRPGELIILAARPSVGKSSLAVQMATAASEAGKPVIIFSLEMSEEDVVMRMASTRSGVCLSKIRDNSLDESEMMKYVSSIGQLSELKVVIKDNPSLSVIKMKSELLKMKRRFGSTGLAVIDYLQLMETKGKEENRATEIANITRQLKKMSREFSCPVLALSQLSRAADDSNSQPKLSHLRESGAIEQDADMVIFIYRSAYGKDPSKLTLEDRYYSELIVAKHRNGPLGRAQVSFVEDTASFVE